MDIRDKGRKRTPRGLGKMRAHRETEALGLRRRLLIGKLVGTSAHLSYRRPPAPYYKRYSYGFRSFRAIISEKTLFYSKFARNVVGSIIREGGQLLVVNTDPLSDHVIREMAEKTKQGYVNYKWIGGFLTNRKHMNREKRLQYLSAQHPGPHSPEVPEKYLQGLITCRGGTPDCSIVMDAHRDFIAIREANQLQIPIVSLVDSTVPGGIHKLITYPIPVRGIFPTPTFAALSRNSVTKVLCHGTKALKPRDTKVKR